MKLKNNKNMENNKAFTLIELLAVIVILAIIALIAVPQILRTLKQARLSAAVDTTYGVVEATETYVGHLMLSNSGDLPINNYEFTCNGTTCSLTNSIKSQLSGYNYEENLNIKGTIPKSGTITVSQNGTIVTATDLHINEFICQYNNEIATCEDGNGTSTSTSTTTTTTTTVQQQTANLSVTRATAGQINKGDVVTIGTENFDVVYKYTDDNNTPSDATDDVVKVVMLAQYNLNVGNNTQDEQYGAIGMQNTRAIGYNSDTTTASGSYWPATLEFALDLEENAKYWLDENDDLKSKYGSDFPAEIFDENSNLYSYVATYKNSLNTLLSGSGKTVETARLLRYSEAKTLGCDDENDNYTCPTTGENAFVTRTSYWLETAMDDCNVYSIYSHGSFSDDSYYTEDRVGIRPVIIMNESDLN